MLFACVQAENRCFSVFISFSSFLELFFFKSSSKRIFRNLSLMWNTKYKDMYRTALK